MSAPIAADSFGVVRGTLTVPANTIPAGAQIVEFYGGAVESPSYASATFVGRGVINLREVQLTRTRNTVARRTGVGDPLAQPIMLPRDTLVSGVNLWFTTPRGTSRIAVQLRENVNGYPGARTIAECTLEPASVVSNGTKTQFRWLPTLLLGNTLYHLVLLCDDAIWRTRIAVLGDVDAPTQHRIMTNPYASGPLLSSSNNLTWTAHQGTAMQFQVVGPKYAQTTRSVALPAKTITNADYIGVMATVERPTVDTDVIFRCTLPDTTVLDLQEGLFTLLPSRLSGTLSITAILTGTADASPIVGQDIQILVGTTNNTSVYQSRAVNIAPSANSYPTKITVVYEKVSGAGTVLVEAHNGTTWVTVPVDGSAWILPMADGWEEVILRLGTFPTGVASTPLRITFTGTAWNRPEIRNLRAIFSDNPP